MTARALKNRVKEIMVLYMALGVITVEWSQSPELDSNVEFAPASTFAKSVKLRVMLILSSKSDSTNRLQSVAS